MGWITILLTAFVILTLLREPVYVILQYNDAHLQVDIHFVVLCIRIHPKHPSKNNSKTKPSADGTSIPYLRALYRIRRSVHVRIDKLSIPLPLSPALSYPIGTAAQYLLLPFTDDACPDRIRLIDADRTVSFRISFFASLFDVIRYLGIVKLEKRRKRKNAYGKYGRKQNG